MFRFHILGFLKMIYLQELQSTTGSISLVGSTLAGMTIAVDRFFFILINCILLNFAFLKFVICLS